MSIFWYTKEKWKIISPTACTKSTPIFTNCSWNEKFRTLGCYQLTTTSSKIATGYWCIPAQVLIPATKVVYNHAPGSLLRRQPPAGRGNDSVKQGHDHANLLGRQLHSLGARQLQGCKKASISPLYTISTLGVPPASTKRTTPGTVTDTSLAHSTHSWFQFCLHNILIIPPTPFVSYGTGQSNSQLKCMTQPNPPPRFTNCRLELGRILSFLPFKAGAWLWIVRHSVMRNTWVALRFQLWCANLGVNIQRRCRVWGEGVSH